MTFVIKIIKYIFEGKWRLVSFSLVIKIANFIESIKVFDSTNVLSCPLCGYSANSFRHFCNELRIAWNSACPNCNSRSRHRGLKFLYEAILENSDKKRILHFAPEPYLSDFIYRFKQHDYYTTDYLIKNVDYPKEDIQNLSFKNSSFDLVFCNHVLEHVNEDILALKEISRILDYGGIAIITIPGNWRRKNTVLFHDLKFNGHYRDYGCDIYNHMIEIFSTVKKINLAKYGSIKYAIKPLEPTFVCLK